MQVHILIFSFLFAVTSSDAVEPQTEVLSLRDAARVMLENNPTLVQKSLETQKAGKGIQAESAAYFPNVDFSQQWNRSNNQVYVFGSLLQQEQFTEANFAINSLNDPAPLTDITSRFSLSWLLYDFGRRESRVSSAKQQKQIATLQQQSSTNRHLVELVRRYFAVSLAEARIRAAADAVASAKTRKNDAAQRVEEGMSVESDLLSAEVHLSRMQQEQIDAANQYTVSVAALSELLGISADRNILTSPLKDKQIVLDDFPVLVTQMKQNIPELKLVSEQKTLAELQKKLAKSYFFPELQAWSAYEWHGETHDYTGSNWGAGVQLKWNVFSGFSDKAMVESATLDSKMASERERELENALLLQLKSAYFQLQSAIEKRKVTSATVEHARENRRILADRYQEGLITIQDSLQAESDYSSAQLMHLQNLYSVYTGYSDLLSAVGRAQDIVLLEADSDQFQEGAK